MSERLQDFVARFAWRFVPSAQDTISTPVDSQAEVPGGSEGEGGAGNAGYVLYHPKNFLHSRCLH